MAPYYCAAVVVAGTLVLAQGGTSPETAEGGLGSDVIAATTAPDLPLVPEPSAAVPADGGPRAVVPRQRPLKTVGDTEIWEVQGPFSPAHGALRWTADGDLEFPGHAARKPEKPWEYRPEAPRTYNWTLGTGRPLPLRDTETNTTALGSDAACAEASVACTDFGAVELSAGRLVTQLRPGHGHIDWGADADPLMAEGDTDRSDADDGTGDDNHLLFAGDATPVLHRRDRAPLRLDLPNPMGDFVAVDDSPLLGRRVLRHDASLDAYFVWTAGPVAGLPGDEAAVELARRWAERDCRRAHWLHASGAVSSFCVPYLPGANSLKLEVVPVRNGLFVATGHHSAPPTRDDQVEDGDRPENGGAYFVRYERDASGVPQPVETRRLMDGAIEAPTVSADGCRVAFRFGQTWQALHNFMPGQPSLRVANFCAPADAETQFVWGPPATAPGQGGDRPLLAERKR